MFRLGKLRQLLAHQLSSKQRARVRSTGGASSAGSGHRTFPICTANLAQAFQGNTAQLLQQLQVPDKELIHTLYRGMQDQKTGHRFNGQHKYEEQISFNYHITQREKMLNQADLMRRWHLPFSHWIAQPSPYQTMGNEFIKYTPEQKMRDSYMTTDEAAKIAAGAGVIVGGDAARAARKQPSLTEMLTRGVGIGGESNGSSATTANGDHGDIGDANNAGNTSLQDANGIHYVPVDGLLEHETKQCVVCQETFNSVFNDADRWVYKPVRRVPAGLIHAHCWTPDAETFQQPSQKVSKKRALEEDDNDVSGAAVHPPSKRTKK